MINVRSNATREQVLARMAEAQSAALEEATRPRKGKVKVQEPEFNHVRLRSRPDFTKPFSANGSFNGVEELGIRLDEYFAAAEAERRTPTVAALALYLGYPTASDLKTACTNTSLEYSDMLTAAVTYLEVLRNEDLLSGGPATSGIMFDLKNNHNWRDKIETEVVERADTLTLLVQSLQGKVLRPQILIEDGEFTAETPVVETLSVKYREEDII